MKIAKSLLPALMLTAVALPSNAAPVKWQPSVAAAIKEAKRSGKPVFIDFYATWCGPCKLLDQAYDKPALKAEASRYVMVKVDVDKSQAEAQKYGIQAMPTMVFLNRNGKVVARKEGFAVPQSARTEAAIVNHVAKDVAGSMAWIRKNKNKA
jgi:thioredoxin